MEESNSEIEGKVVEYASWFGDSPHYWAQASLPLAYDAACAEVVCRSSEKARPLYNGIAEAWSDARTEATLLLGNGYTTPRWA
jgi:hypothetical protein